MKSTLQVSGMTCQNCVSSVKGALGELTGVSEVDVDLESGQVVVDYDEAEVKLEALKDTVLDQGFDVAE